MSIPAGSNVRFAFTTRSIAGVPTTLSGSPAISVYKDDSTTQSTTGVTLTADFDSVTGFNHVAIDTSADGTFYANGSHFEVVITTGTVGGTSVVGEVVGSFDLAASSSAPTAAAVATAVWQDAVAGDFTVTSSIGKSLYTSGVVPGGTGGHFIAGTNAATVITTSLTTHLIGTVDTVTTLTNLPAIPTNWLTAAGLATDAAAEIATATDTQLTGTHGSGAWGGGSAPSAATIASAVWNEVNTGATHNVNNSAGKQLRTLTTNTGVIYSGTAPIQSGMSPTQFKLDSGASASDNQYQWNVLSIIGGTDAGDSRIITLYNGLSKVATVNAPWTISPDNTSVFEISPSSSTQVVSYITGQDPATLVWAAAARTLTALPSIPANWLTSAGVAAAALNGKGDWLAAGDKVGIADAFLGRNIAGAADGGRTVAEALAFLRNKWTISSGTLTVYATNDTTALWSAAVSTSVSNPVTGVDPA